MLLITEWITGHEVSYARDFNFPVAEICDGGKNNLIFLTPQDVRFEAHTNLTEIPFNEESFCKFSTSSLFTFRLFKILLGFFKICALRTTKFRAVVLSPSFDTTSA